LTWQAVSRSRHEDAPFDAAEEVGGTHRRILLRVRVSFRDEAQLLSAALPADDAVGEQPVAVFAKDHISRLDCVEVEAAEQQDVARPDGGQHARAGDAHARLAAAAQQFRHESRHDLGQR
jgi:hypothetical protein